MEPVQPHHFRSYTGVRHSDQNYIGHMGQVGLLNLLDWCAAVVHQGFARHFSGDLLDYPVRQADLVYQGQSFHDDDLVVLVWDKEDEEDCLCTQLVNR